MDNFLKTVLEQWFAFPESQVQTWNTGGIGAKNFSISIVRKKNVSLSGGKMELYTFFFHFPQSYEPLKYCTTKV